MRLRWSSYVAPKSPKGGLKMQNGRFLLKNAVRLKKVCYKVSLCKNSQRQSSNAFIGLTNRAKIIGGGWPLVPEILDQSDRVCAKSTIFHIFSLVAPQPYQLCENCQGQSCKASTGLTIRVKMIGGWRPLLPEILSQNDRVVILTMHHLHCIKCKWCKNASLTFLPKLTHAAARFVCDSWPTCYTFMLSNDVT